MLITKDFINKRKNYFFSIAKSDKKVDIDSLPDNLTSAMLYLNITMEKYLNTTDKSSVIRLGDKL